MGVPDIVQYGRSSHGGFASANVTTIATEIIPPNPYRISLVISAPVTNPIFIGDGAGLSLTNGMRIPVNVAPVQLNVRDHSQLIQKGIWGIVSAGTEQIGWYESMNEYCVDQSISQSYTEIPKSGTAFPPSRR